MDGICRIICYHLQLSILQCDFPVPSVFPVSIGGKKMIQLAIWKDTVKEIDVVTGREMIQNHTGDYGSICFVIRRPG